MTNTTFAPVQNYEQISFREWNDISFLEKNVFTRIVNTSLQDPNNVLPAGYFEAEMLINDLEASEETKWVITVDEAPVGFWYFTDDDEPEIVKVILYIAPTHKSIEPFISSFFHCLGEKTSIKFVLDLSGYPLQRKSFYTFADISKVKCSELNNKIEHEQVEHLIEKIRAYYE